MVSGTIDHFSQSRVSGVICISICEGTCCMVIYNALIEFRRLCH